MLVVNSSEMKQIDLRAIEIYRIPGIVLMENAAHSVFEEIAKLNPRKVAIVCGPGNNGGDGFAVARLLKTHSYDVDVFFCFDEKKLKGDAKVNYEILKTMDFSIIKDIEYLQNNMINYDLVVDALFGTGLRGEISEESKRIIDVINQGRFILSIDIPSGINSDNGKSIGKCVYADITITFECKKYGHLLGEGREASGAVIVKKISIPKKCMDEQNIKTFSCDDKFPLSIYKRRNFDTNKGDFGKVYIIGGSYNMSGAVILALKAAIKTGSGLVCGVYPESIIDRVATQIPEIINIPCEEKNGFLEIGVDMLNDIINKADVISIGIGMGKGHSLLEMIKYILYKFKGYVVLDADGLNNICEDISLLNEANSKVIITPHPGEMSRLTGLTVDYINSNRVEVAKDFANKYGCVVLLKGSSTVVSNGEETYINTSGNPGMATAGSGDVLTGMITSLLGQGYGLLESGILGSFLHGKAGDEAYKQYGYGLTATDIIENVGKFLKF
ncbi:Bifunctional NAD(P)H-hydrate repair enzyme Nnr [Caloramator mitchellensis]|uniref:Bifunctional NAD(P)H-hydrate repair enzyme n=1 Tax=Caloramator mitchellensis TaxID=908809 RepID=A0A0R3K1K3_CALMK|nr:bifunctional ADP-dependent NAD(P)H-hydrate dehydratase/NAD(P)H-hydrate epimerase [Caloramator mitchellensis]KRQ87132.1 Bifunctional NAD(P)H-hydrate repair enzyme Nnr [Caloramator mitchellensis]